jgi:hypothetical protein
MVTWHDQECARVFRYYKSSSNIYLRKWANAKAQHIRVQWVLGLAPWYTNTLRNYLQQWYQEKYWAKVIAIGWSSDETPDGVAVIQYSKLKPSYQPHGWWGVAAVSCLLGAGHWQWRRISSVSVNGWLEVALRRLEACPVICMELATSSDKDCRREMQTHTVDIAFWQ